jgi:hypothetical protein
MNFLASYKVRIYWQGGLVKLFNLGVCVGECVGVVVNGHGYLFLFVIEPLQVWSLIGISWQFRGFSQTFQLQYVCTWLAADFRITVKDTSSETIQVLKLTLYVTSSSSFAFEHFQPALFPLGVKPGFTPTQNETTFSSALTLWRRSSSKCYLRIQSVPQREHHASPLQRSTG